MHIKGSVKHPVGERGYLCGPSLTPEQPLYWNKAEVAYMYLDSKSTDPLHYHKRADEFLILIKGSLRQEVDGEEIELAPGDFLFIRAGTKTELRYAQDGTELIVLKAPPDPHDKVDLSRNRIK